MFDLNMFGKLNEMKQKMEEVKKRLDTVEVEGEAGDFQGLDQFLIHAKKLLKTGGQILLDSSDIKYMYEEEDGSILLELTHYYGEMTYQMEYNKILGDAFKWLYVNNTTLQHHATANQYTCEILYEGEHFEYLAMLKLED